MKPVTLDSSVNTPTSGAGRAGTACPRLVRRPPSGSARASPLAGARRRKGSRGAAGTRRSMLTRPTATLPGLAAVMHVRAAGRSRWSASSPDPRTRACASGRGTTPRRCGRPATPSPSCGLDGLAALRRRRSSQPRPPARLAARRHPVRPVLGPHAGRAAAPAAARAGGPAAARSIAVLQSGRPGLTARRGLAADVALFASERLRRRDRRDRGHIRRRLPDRRHGPVPRRRRSTARALRAELGVPAGPPLVAARRPPQAPRADSTCSVTLAESRRAVRADGREHLDRADPGSGAGLEDRGRPRRPPVPARHRARLPRRRRLRVPGRGPAGLDRGAAVGRRGAGERGCPSSQPRSARCPSCSRAAAASASPARTGSPRAVDDRARARRTRPSAPSSRACSARSASSRPSRTRCRAPPRRGRRSSCCRASTARASRPRSSSSRERLRGAAA